MKVQRKVQDGSVVGPSGQHRELLLQLMRTSICKMSLTMIMMMRGSGINSTISVQYLRAHLRSISALLTQSTVTLAPEGDAEILSIKPQKQSGMFASAPRSLQLR